MERGLDIKRFLLRNGTELTVWAQGGKLYAIAFKDREPLFSHILQENDIRKLVHENKLCSRNELKTSGYNQRKGDQLPIGFFMSPQFERNIPPKITVGRRIGTGVNGRVFECLFPRGYVLKVVHLIRSPREDEDPRVAFLKEVKLACEMSILDVGPKLECFWIGDEIMDLKGSESERKEPLNKERGDSFGFILSKQMDMTYHDFLEYYPESYYEPEEGEDPNTELARSENRKKVQEFVDRLKKACYTKQVLIHEDLHLSNIMVNIKPVNQLILEWGHFITDIRVVDFGVSMEFPFDLDYQLWLNKIVKGELKWDDSANDPALIEITKRLKGLEKEQEDFEDRMQNIINGVGRLRDETSS